MSRHRWEAYLDKVFGFSALVDALPEGREFPQHRWKKVFDAVFLGAAMQIPSLLQIEAECYRLRARKTISRTGVRAQLRNRPPPETQRSSTFRLVQRVGGGGGRWHRDLQFVRPVLRCLHGAGSSAQNERRDANRYSVLSPDRRGRCGQHAFPHPLGSSLSEKRGRRGSLRAGSAPRSGPSVRPALPGCFGG